MNALGNLIAGLVKWTLIGSVLIIGSFLGYLVLAQDSIKKENARIQKEQAAAWARDAIQADLTGDWLEIRYYSGDDQARYYLMGLMYATKTMMIMYQDWCPPRQEPGVKLTPDIVLQQIFHEWKYNDIMSGQSGDFAVARAMLRKNSCRFNDWPELIK